LADGESRPIEIPAWFPKTLVTSSIPVTLDSTKSAAFLGQWDNLVFGIRNELRIEVLREKYADEYNIALLGALRADVGVLRPSAFQIIKDIVDGWYSA
jgi:HK97 family phage major capsid protein